MDKMNSFGSSSEDVEILGNLIFVYVNSQLSGSFKVKQMYLDFINGDSSVNMSENECKTNR
jgi:hypothetical protein